jgi:hypothetical protein
VAKTESYKITYDDGEVRYRLLDPEGVEKFEKLAKNKASEIKSIAKGEPTPNNK